MIGTKSRILLFSGMALGHSVLCYLALHHSVSNGKVSKVYGRDVAEGMRVWNPKAGVDSIRFESCRVEKLKSGPITFGGLDVLCITGLVVNLPFPDEEEKGVESGGSKNTIEGIPKSLLHKAALPFERVSGVRVKGLAVNRIEGCCEVPVFTAEEMRNRGRSLVLTNCRVFENGKTNFARKATLTMTPSPVLAWNGGERRLEERYDKARAKKPEAEGAKSPTKE